MRLLLCFVHSAQNHLEVGHGESATSPIHVELLFIWQKSL